MGRVPRVEYGGARYHITARGNKGAKVFVEDTDRSMFLAGLADLVRDAQWIFHAYCLMGTHYHLVVETPEANLGEGMQSLHTAYVHRFNAAHKVEGHLLERRYRAKLIEEEGHMDEVLRYVPLNPVRARLCTRPEDWPWSSYRATIGLAPEEWWLTTSLVVDVFGSPTGYRSWVEGAIDRDPLDLALAGGSPEGIRRARSLGYSLDEIGEHLGISRITVWRRETKVPGTFVSDDDPESSR